jgi:glycine cleavage system protein P-like pyridoxal-binding family
LYKRCNVDPALIKAQRQSIEKAKANAAANGVTNKAFTKDEEKEKEKEKVYPGPVDSAPQYVIVDCSGFSYIDLMGVNALKQVSRQAVLVTPLANSC